MQGVSFHHGRWTSPIHWIVWISNSEIISEPSSSLGTFWINGIGLLFNIPFWRVYRSLHRHKWIARLRSYIYIFSPPSITMQSWWALHYHVRHKYQRCVLNINSFAFWLSVDYSTSHCLHWPRLLVPLLPRNYYLQIVSFHEPDSMYHIETSAGHHHRHQDVPPRLLRHPFNEHVGRSFLNRFFKFTRIERRIIYFALNGAALFTFNSKSSGPAVFVRKSACICSIGT